MLVANLVRFATPGSLSRHIARHWLALIALAGVLLAIVGPTLGLQGTTYVGFAVILGCFAGWVVQRLFGRYLGGKSIWKDAALYLFAVVVVGLMVLGAFKAVELVKDWLL